MSLSNGGGWFNGFTTDRFLPRVHPLAAHPILPILASQEIPTSCHGYSVNHEHKGDTSTHNVFLILVRKFLLTGLGTIRNRAC
jgi:hypothetical protein